MIAPILLAALAAPVAVPAPIASVTVFGDRARVVRTTSLPAGAAQVTFPLLPETAERDSIRLDVRGATLERVQIGDVPPAEFPVGPGQKLLAELQQLDDRIAGLDRQAGAVREALQLLRGATPGAGPEAFDSAGRRVEPLDPARWGEARAFAQKGAASLREQLRSLDGRARDLRRQRDRLAEQAQLLGATRRPSGSLVTAWLHGGAGRATLTYDVARATWRPIYDVQLDPATNEVTLSLAGLVSQQTGEDWTRAQLTLSTAVPATAKRYPDLPVWKIGEKERFIPTPVPHPLPLAPAPPAPPLPEAENRGEALRQKLLALAAAPAAQAQPSGQGEESGAPPPAGRPEPAPVESAPPPPAPMEEDRIEAAPAAPMPMPPRTFALRRPSAFAAPPEAPAGLPLGPPVQYRPPYVPPDYPASLAGGYDLEYRALRPESVPSGDGQRRVALGARRFAARLTREIFPALAQAAFLVARLDNASPDPIAAGPSELFVGDDPAGFARLPLVGPGEHFTLPLGVDRAVQPVRRIDLVQGEAGFFSKDDVRSYKVTIELANPYSRPIGVRVTDQWPVSHDEHLKITLDEVSPQAAQDSGKGELDWTLTLPPASKQILAFSFTVRCPKGWLLTQ